MTFDFEIERSPLNMVLLSIQGWLEDVQQETEAMCLLVSPEPVTQEFLDAVSLEIAAMFVTDDEAQLRQAKEHPFEAIQGVLQKHGLELLDIAAMWIALHGSVWRQMGGHNFHANILHRVSFKE